MFYYVVEFNGVWPVPAMAVVRAKDIVEGREKFWKYCPKYIASKNTNDTIYIRRLYNDFEMLSDGDY